MTRHGFISAATTVVLLFAVPVAKTDGAERSLKVSDNGRFLVTPDGSPFFYLGDTAWELFHRLSREEADLYLADRAAKKFTVIQAVVLAELDGLTAPNPYGHTPLIDNDPARPNEGYFEHVDYIVNKAASLGLVVGMLPTWGDKVNKKWGVGPEVFTPANAESFGAFLGKRYKDKPIIWILGGDRPIEKAVHLDIWRAMAKGIRAGDAGRNLITYHPMGGSRSSQWLHGEPWLDFNTFQSGHSERDLDTWNMVAADRALRPVKPTLDSEPCYENHPVNWKRDGDYWFDEYDVRKQVYRSLFAGACGVTYGCHDVWQFWAQGRTPISFARTSWQDAIKLPASGQMRHARALLESRPMLTRVPDQAMLKSNPGKDGTHVRATRDESGAYAMVYLPTAAPVTVDLSRISGAVHAWWFDPRTGRSTDAGKFENRGDREFRSPATDAAKDWVLVLDDESKNYGAPGLPEPE